jgi:putative pyruvate formate lyase activating enzyme
MDAVEYVWQKKGPLKLDKNRCAISGLIVRHLLLPDMLSNPLSVLDFLACLSLKIPVSLLAQYNPGFYTGDIAQMKRCITQEEYKAILNKALKFGFETIYSQDVDSSENYAPDFRNLHPFGDGINLLLRDNFLLDESPS